MALLHWLLCIDLARVCACVFECVCVLFDPCKPDPLFYGLSRKIVVKPRSPCLRKPSVTQSSDFGLGLFAHKELSVTQKKSYTG